MTEERDAADVVFQAGQDGAVEQDLKSALSTLFEEDGQIEKAYLIRATLGGQPTVILGLKTSGPEDLGLLSRIDAAFRTIFASSQHIDVLFLSEQQHADADRICRPFFGR